VPRFRAAQGRQASLCSAPTFHEVDDVNVINISVFCHFLNNDLHGLINEIKMELVKNAYLPSSSLHFPITSIASLTKWKRKFAFNALIEHSKIKISPGRSLFDRRQYKMTQSYKKITLFFTSLITSYLYLSQIENLAMLPQFR
jgi:hypothetical protein